MTRYRSLVTRYALLAVSIGLTACAGDPQRYIPETQRAVLELEASGSAQAGPISVEELLTRVGRQPARPPRTVPLRLGFAPGSDVLVPSDKDRLDEFLAAQAGPSRLRLSAGLAEGPDRFAALALAHRRLAAIERLLPVSWPAPETLYRPDITADTLIIELREGNDDGRT